MRDALAAAVERNDSHIAGEGNIGRRRRAGPFRGGR